MNKLNKYYKLEKQAEKYYQKYSNRCEDIFHFISPMIEIDIDSHITHIFRQTGDGYVLCWEDNNTTKNTPVECIIEEYEKQGQPLSAEDLREISI